jgi:hypothetical protein
MPKGNPHPKDGRKNLKPYRTKEEARINGIKGGIKSGQVKRQKKLMSAILADYLARQQGFDSFDKYINKVLKRGNSATVQMIKTFVESIEGTKIKTEININQDDPIVQELLKKHGVSKN